MEGKVGFKFFWYNFRDSFHKPEQKMNFLRIFSFPYHSWSESDVIDSISIIKYDDIKEINPNQL